MPNGNTSVLKNSEIQRQSFYDALDGILGPSKQAYFAKHFHIPCSKTAMAPTLLSFNSNEASAVTMEINLPKVRTSTASIPSTCSLGGISCYVYLV